MPVRTPCSNRKAKQMNFTSLSIFLEHESFYNPIWDLIYYFLFKQVQWCNFFPNNIFNSFLSDTILLLSASHTWECNELFLCPSILPFLWMLGLGLIFQNQLTVLDAQSKLLYMSCFRGRQILILRIRATSQDKRSQHRPWTCNEFVIPL